MLSALRRLDAYVPVSRDVSRSSQTGGLFTILAASLCSLLFLQLVKGYFFEEAETSVRLLDPDAFTIDINLDIQLWDLPCEYLGVGVWDVLGADLVTRKTDLEDAITTDDMRGGISQYTEDEVEVLEEIEEARVALAAANTAATDKEKRKEPDMTQGMDAKPHPLRIEDMSEVANLADYVFVAFTVDWCPYCTRLTPIWQDFAVKHVNVVSRDTDLYKQATDSEGKPVTFRAVTVSCQMSEKLCRSEGIDAYPTIRLYRGKKSHEVPPGMPSPKRFIEFAKRVTQKHHKIDPYSVRHHKIFNKGCRVKGTLSVPAVPGVLRIGPKAHMPRLNQTVNPRLVNVSHAIHHFSFGYSRKGSSWATGLIGKDSSPMDGTRWVVHEFHQAPVHYLSVVSTVTSSQRSVFKTAASHRTAQLSKDATPLVTFNYDLSPIEVVHFSEEMSLYNFFTSVFAVVGGSYAVVGLLSQILTRMR